MLVHREKETLEINTLNNYEAQINSICYKIILFSLNTHIHLIALFWLFKLTICLLQLNIFQMLIHHSFMN